MLDISEMVRDKGIVTIRAVKRLISLIMRLIFVIARFKCGFHAHFIFYIFQFVCVPFAGGRRRL